MNAMPGQRPARVTVEGCDGVTIVDLDLTDAEYATLERIAAATVAMSETPCEPVVKISRGEGGRAE